MDEIAVGNLIERIYDTALEPRLWPDLISTLEGLRRTRRLDRA
jgi:hypothetical protein